MKTYFVYIMANKKNGTLYLGVTSNLQRRVWKHKNNVHEGFTKKYGVHRLVWYEMTNQIEAAIRREKQLKRTPHIQAKALFKSVQQKYPWKFTDGQLRTFQRRVKAWRLEQASRQLERTENIGENSELATIRQGKILT